MAFEIRPWKKEGCSLNLRTPTLSTRETFSREINEEYSEGGGLNADYQTVEALAKATNILGVKGALRYGKDFLFKTSGLAIITLDFANQRVKNLARKILRKYIS